MKKAMLFLLAGALVFSSGCVEGMTDTQKSAMIGTLIGGLGGAMSSKKNRNRNALIGAGVGALGGGLYGKNKEATRLRQENMEMRRELETYEMRRELERLRKENAELRGGRKEISGTSLADIF